MKLKLNKLHLLLKGQVICSGDILKVEEGQTISAFIHRIEKQENKTKQNKKPKEFKYNTLQLDCRS